jgi:hypothetical protein
MMTLLELLDHAEIKTKSVFGANDKNSTCG